VSADEVLALADEGAPWLDRKLATLLDALGVEAPAAAMTS
jgi:hypothetical protein